MPVATKKEKAPSQRVKALKIHPYTLALFLQEGNKLELIKGVPAGATLTGAGFDSNTNSFYLYVEHKSFEEVPFGQQIPHFTVEIKDLRQKTKEEK